MGIYRGAGGTGDAVNDSSSEAVVTVDAKNAALAAQAAAEAAKAGAVVAEASAVSQASSAALSATNAAISATTAIGAIASTQAAATSASDSAAAALTSKNNADTSATNAAASATSASTSATSASTSASSASTSATNASNSATSASNSATTANTAATNAAASYDAFDDRYLGAKTTPPTVDNDGNALLIGALYYKTTGTPQLYIWNGTAWDQAALNASGAVVSFNTRVGAVTLSSSDVTNALTYTPYNSTNPSGYITNTNTNTFTANQVVSVTDNTNAALRITQLGTGNALVVEDSATPDGTPFVIDASGNVGIGITPAFANTKLSTAGAGSDAATWAFRYSADNVGYENLFIKSRGTGLFSPAIVQSGDRLGGLRFAGWDGAAYTGAASIVADVDGTPGTNDMPGRLIFSTTPDGSASPVERMRIDNAGRVLVGTTTNTNASTLVSGGTISETVGGVQHLVASQFDVGTAPNKIPLNQYLGNMAYQTSNAVNITGGNTSNLQSLTNLFVSQPTPSAINASATLTIAELLTRIITTNNAAAVAFTLPTGTLTDAGILSGQLLVNQSFDWNIINTGSAVGIITVSSGTNNTLIGSGVIAITTSATFRTVKTATNTYNTYRVN